MKLTCREIAEACGGRLLHGDPDTDVNSFSIDTRSIQPEDFFVPLPGEKVDGHVFIKEAFTKGAAGSFYALDDHQSISRGVIIQVEDVLEALQKTAAYYRNRFHIPVVGVTGSSGKTTTKDMIASVLNKAYPILKTEGNYNNHIGLPLTILRLEEKYRAAVLEMAMRGAGEISLLAEIARPQWGVITNIGEAHIELLGSKENIAKAKGELLDVMGHKGSAILYGDDPYLRQLGKNYTGDVYYYGWNEDSDFKISPLKSYGQDSRFIINYPGGESIEYCLPYPGRHMISNATVAIALGFLLGVPSEAVKKGINEAKLTEGRLQILRSDQETEIIDDTYNANPSSMSAALEVLGKMGQNKRKIAVLGDMLELGDISEEAHRKIGLLVAQHGVDILLTVGKWSKYISQDANGNGVNNYHCGHNAGVIEFFHDLSLGEGDIVLVKGSRGMHLEEVVDYLKSKK